MRTSQYLLSTLEGDTCRRRGYQPSADAARRDDPQAGLRVIHLAADRRARPEKVENIVREEMNNAGAIEVLMPVVQPSELWRRVVVGNSTARNCCALLTVANVRSCSARLMKK